ncbi:hypothetical protein BS78_05G069200 [Paspalum vaginatum]|nr:hypothetical protein BS78_05G069200 [Paspalum vaginatum]
MVCYLVNEISARRILLSPAMAQGRTCRCQPLDSEHMTSTGGTAAACKIGIGGQRSMAWALGTWMACWRWSLDPPEAG